MRKNRKREVTVGNVCGFCTTRFLTKVTLIVAVKLSLLLHSICHSNSVFCAVWRRNTTSMLTQVMTHVSAFMLMYCDDIKYTFTYNGIFVCFKAVIVNRLTLRNWKGCSVLFPNNNNNNNKHDNVYGAVIMAEPLREFTRFIWWM